MKTYKLSDNARKQVSKTLLKAMVEPGSVVADILGELDFYFDEDNALDCQGVSITYPVLPKEEMPEG